MKPQGSDGTKHVEEQSFGRVDLELDSDPSLFAEPTPVVLPPSARRPESDASLGSTSSDPTVGAIGARMTSLAAIRELYARGEAQEALALAAELGVHLGASGDEGEGRAAVPSDDAGTAVVDMDALRERSRPRGS